VLGLVHYEIDMGVDGKALGERGLRAQACAPHAKRSKQFVPDHLAKWDRAAAGDELPENGVAEAGVVEPPPRAPQ
jgi:hypothetical protein